VRHIRPAIQKCIFEPLQQNLLQRRWSHWTMCWDFQILWSGSTK